MVALRCVFLLVLSVMGVQAAAAQDAWCEFLGPTGDGVVPSGTQLPLTWSEESHVVWKTAIPLRGWSSPVVADGVVWMTTATDDGHKLFAIAVALDDGRVLHNREVLNVPRPQGRNAVNSYASPTPVIAGNRVVMTFGGAGTVCLDTVTADTVWERRDLLCNHHGNAAGSSPIVAGGHVILTMDGTDKQYIIALNIQTGETVWRVKRDFDYASLPVDLRKAYGTPLRVSLDEREATREVVISHAAAVAWCYDAATGGELWRFAYEGGFSNTAKPLVWRDRVVINSGFTVGKLFCVPLTARGEINDDQVAWVVNKNVTLAPTPVVLHESGCCVMVDGKGIVTCLDLTTGNPRWTHRLGGVFWASPLFSDNRVYLFNSHGKTTVIAADPAAWSPLATNHLDDGCMATPAAVDNSLIIRTRTHLYRIRE